VDLRPGCPPVYDQGSLNACSAHAIAAALWFDELERAGSTVPGPSRLFLYYNERARQDLVGTNAPVSLRDGYRSIEHTGTCPESRWPYDVARFARKPSPACYRAARDLRVIAYARVRQEAMSLRGALAQRHPIAFGISVFESFESPRVRRTGRVPVPGHDEHHLGGHALLLVGYDDARRVFIARNSWGPRWGLGGYCEMPYAYALNPALAWDFWIARRLLPRRRGK